MKRLVALVPVLFVLAACGGGAGGEGGLPETATPADLPTLAGQVEGSLGVECGEPLVDGMGFGKVVCSLPDGAQGAGMAIQSWTDRAALESFEDAFAEGAGFVAGEGWFVHAPTQAVADEVAAVISG